MPTAAQMAGVIKSVCTPAQVNQIASDIDRLLKIQKEYAATHPVNPAFKQAELRPGQ